MSNVLVMTPAHGRARIDQQAKFYLHQLCADTGYSQENLLGAMHDRDGCWERERERETGNSVQSAWLDDYDDDD